MRPRGRHSGVISRVLPKGRAMTMERKQTQ